MEKETTLNACVTGGCHAGCIHKTYVKDGKIIKVERLIYPDGEVGTMCSKAVAGARIPYHVDRLKYPLKRAGRRGEGKWERITWEQALDEIAEKIKKIREEYKPESVAVVPWGNSSSPMAGLQTALLGIRLQNLLQASDFTVQGMPIDSAPFFSGYFNFGETTAVTIDPRTLVEGNTKYMIAWGCNPVEMAPRFWEQISKARKKGAKLVDIGLMYDPTAKNADWFIPVKAGSDTALALSMINVIINETLYDEEYVIKYTNGPFLVRMDNGKFLRESDILPEGDPQKYIVWDAVSSQSKAIAPGTYEFSGYKPALLGTYRPEGVDCKPAFQLLADLANKHLPEKAAEITAVPSETIKKLAREYATTKPAAILIFYGLRYKNSGNAYRVINTLGAITGNISVMGGGTILGGATQAGIDAPQLHFNDFPIVCPTEARSRTITRGESFQCMITGRPYPIKALLMSYCNPVHTFPNPQRWIKEAFPSLELIVVHDIFVTATAEYADYVLPDCTIFEREDIDIGPGGYIVLEEKAIEPMYECRAGIYFWSELANRLGLGEYFDKTIEEWIALMLKSDNPSIAGIEPPLTFERLKKEKIIRANVPKEIHHPFLDKRFPTPSGRIEFYCEDLAIIGDGLPVFREQLESPRSALAEKYPLVFNTANNKFFLHSILANDSSGLLSYKKEPYLSINPLDAKKRGIKEDDLVVVYNDRGSCKVKAMLTEVVPPGVVHIPHGWWPKQFIEGHLANLLPSLASPETREEATELYYSLVVERGTGDRPGYSNPLLFAGFPDTLFDCLCEVKKV